MRIKLEIFTPDTNTGYEPTYMEEELSKIEIWADGTVWWGEEKRDIDWLAEFFENLSSMEETFHRTKDSPFHARLIIQ